MNVNYGTKIEQTLCCCHVANYCIININSDKTTFKMIQLISTVHIDIHYRIKTFQLLESTKYLALAINDELTWHHHVEEMSQKIIAMLGTPSRCSDFHLIHNPYSLKYKIPDKYMAMCGVALFRKEFLYSPTGL